MTDWFYNEQKHCGVDYSQDKEADNYDNRHQDFRNYENEFNEMLKFLSLKDTQNMAMIDLGCGTGATTTYASRLFKEVFAVDISDVMLEKAKSKALSLNLPNINWIQSGFLTYKHKSDPVDILITQFAFHHLPDFWKQIALINMNKMLKTGGILYIADVIYQFDPMEYETKITQWIKIFENKIHKNFLKEFITHIKEEFSTFHWILEGMLLKAGFKIEKKRSQDGFISEYHCIKTLNLS